MFSTLTNRSIRRGEGWLITAVATIVLGWYTYATHRTVVTWVTREPQGYYEHLTAAILDGQTYLKLTPDPRLARLANPWGGAQGIPRAHDASYYNGRYYLYFGVTPVILLLAPWRLLTGTYLSDGAAVGVLLAAGFLLASWFFLRCRRYFFSELPAWWSALGVLTLGLGSYLQFNIWGGQFYLVPIACAFACGVGAAHGVLTAALAETNHQRAFGLGLASFAWGCAVGARPNYLLGLLPLGAIGFWLWWRIRHDPVEGWRRGWLLVMVMLPATLIGVGLAAYNYARFGDIFEFGLRHQFAAVDMHSFKLMGWENVQPALAAYLWSPPHYSLYYPFIRLTNDTFGLLTWAPFTLWAIALLTGRGFAWRMATGFCLLVGLVNLGGLLGYSYLLGRYEIDFVAWLMLAGLLGASNALVNGRGRPQFWQWGIRLAVGLPLAWTFAHSLIHSWPDTNSWSEVRTVARVLNRAPAWFEQIQGWRHGPITMQVTLPPIGVGAREPLLATGGGRDVVYVQRTDEDHFQFGFTHRGMPGVMGRSVLTSPGSQHQIEIDLGGLYPPNEHPLFNDWMEGEVAVLRRRVAVKCDGRLVLRAESSFYASDPRLVLLGATALISWLPPLFTGRIERVGHLGIPPRSSLAQESGSGPVRLRVKFPEFKAMVGEPLVCTGRPGAGDMVYAFYLGPGLLRFAHDSWNSGQLESSPVFFDPAQEHVIDLDFGALQPVSAPAARAWGAFRLRFDGRDILDERRPFHPAMATEVSFGYNAIGASTADAAFRGERLEVERLARLPELGGAIGPLALTLRLPTARVGQSEPLVVTGRSGAGDFIYIKYLDGDLAQIGYDHWGVGGPLSEPFPVAADAPILVQVSLGAFYPEGPNDSYAIPADFLARARAVVRVQVNGRMVLNVAARPHPSGPAEIFIGLNPLGGSTCDKQFTGEIIRGQRVDPLTGW